MRFSRIQLFTFALVAVCAPRLASAQVTLPFEGFLTDTPGMPITEQFDAIVRLYDAEGAETPVFEEEHFGVVPFDGFFYLSIGETSSISPSLFGGELYVGIEIVGDDVEMAPRFAVGFVPFTVRALSADGGEIGPAGPPGPIGPTGPTGATGAVGPQGPAGADGADGADGAVGPAGPTGAQGAEGPTGAMGPMGATGALGPQGPRVRPAPWGRWGRRDRSGRRARWDRRGPSG